MPANILLGAVLALGLAFTGAERCIARDLWLGFGALALSVFALRATRVWHFESSPADDRTTSWVALLLVLATTVFFRTYRLVPPGLWGDDAINGLLAYEVLDGRVPSPFTLVRHSHSVFHALTNFAIAGSFHWFGASLATLRLPGIVAGCSAGLLLYGLTRQLFGRVTALLAGLLFASAPLQIAHSKSLIQVVFGLTFQLAAVYAFVRGTSQRKTGWLVLAMIPLAATVYTYHSAKLAPLVLLPLIVAEVRRARPHSRITARSLTLVAATFIVCLIPAAYSYWHNPQALVGRAQTVSLLGAMRESGSLEPLWSSLIHTLGIFQVEQGPPLYHWFGPGTDPALTPIVAGLVLHGLLQSILHWRQPRHQLLLFWFALGLAPALLSTEAPRGYRALLATPPLFVWAALPLSTLWKCTSPRKTLRAMVVATVIAGLIFDFNYYFHRTYTHPHARWTLGERLVEIGRVTRSAGKGWTGYVMSPTFTSGYESLRLLARMWDLDLRDAASLHDALNLDPLPQRGAIFFTAPGSHAAAHILRRYLENSVMLPLRDPQPHMWWNGAAWPYQPMLGHREPIIIALTATRESMARQQSNKVPLPVRVRCRSKTSSFDRREPSPFYDFFADTFAEPMTCRWNTSIDIPATGTHVLHFSADGDLEITIDGEKRELAVSLAPGRHELYLRTTEARRRIQLKIQWEDPQGRRAIVPPRAWRASKSSKQLR